MRNQMSLKILKIMFGLVLLSVMLMFVLGEMLLPAEDAMQNGACTQLQAEWERVHEDGAREKVQLPGRCDAKWGEVVRLETVLPDTQQDTWICMRASQQDMRIYVDGELRQEYAPRNSLLFSRNSASAFVFAKILCQDAGKVLAIELESDSEYTGFLNPVYEGEKYDIAAMMLEECALVLGVAVFMLIISGMTLFLGCVLRLIYKRRVDILYLALGSLLLSSSMLVESRIRQFFLPNSSVAAHTGLLLTILIPYPFMVYVSRVQGGRYKGAYRILSLCVAFNLAGSILLQFLHILDLADTMVVSYVVILAMLLVMAVTICLDAIRKRIREYGVVAWGFGAMIFVALCEVYINFFPEVSLHGGILLSLGLLILLLFAGVKTVQDLAAVEREKQMAIASSDAQTKFIANISHEIRTPINTILGMNEMILRESSEGEVLRYAGNVRSAGELLIGLINDVLDYSKMEAGMMVLTEADYYPAEMLSDVIAGIQIKAGGKGLTFQTEIAESIPRVLHGDEIRICQILNNLLTNAVKYTSRGTVKLTVRGMHTENGFMLYASVQDTGTGIREEDMDKLFDSFKRLEEKKNRHIEGTGLGLNITKQLLELMGGSISVQSVYGQGSCFTVMIPQEIVDVQPMGNLEEAYRKAMMDAARTQTSFYAPDAEILVVDDNEMNLMVMRALLKRTGVKLTTASGGAKCMELCRIHRYDLILMDHMMPDPDGVETLHMLRKDKNSRNKDTKVIVLTANAMVGAAEEYLREGFADYLSKPVMAEALEKMMNKHLPTEGKAEQANEPDLLEIDRAKGLAFCSDDEEVYKEILETFSAEGLKNLDKLGEYYGSEDWKNYKIVVHAIKGTSRLIGADAFSEKAKQLEMAAKDGRVDIIKAQHEQFLGKYRELLQRVAAEIEK